MDRYDFGFMSLAVVVGLIIYGTVCKLPIVIESKPVSTVEKDDKYYILVENDNYTETGLENRIGEYGIITFDDYVEYAYASNSESFEWNTYIAKTYNVNGKEVEYRTCSLEEAEMFKEGIIK